MQMFLRLLSLVLLIAVISAAALAADPAAAPTVSQQPSDPLIKVLVAKGVITPDEGRTLSWGTAAEQRDKLLLLLQQKGILTTADTDALQTSSSAAASLETAAMVQGMKAEAKPAPAPPPAPAVIPAVAPIRVLQLEAGKPGGLVPDIKLGSGAKLKLYGFYKSSVVYDSSSPLGNDFPLPQFLASDTGPGGSPEFHIKARAFRTGANFEWPDLAGSNNTLTGRVEFDFEGDFTRANNRNISSIRSNQLSLRLAWMRIDHRFSEHTTGFALFGQDWTPFGSSVLPNSLETTGLGLAYGSLYERAPQVRLGIDHNFGGSRNFHIAPEFAMVLPAYGNTPPFIGIQSVSLPATMTVTITAANCPVLPCTVPVTTIGSPVTVTTASSGLVGNNLGDQLGYGERQGVDSARPEVEGRIVFQWQLDKARGVAPAQIILSGVQGSRRAIVTASAIPTCSAALQTVPNLVLCPGGATTFKTAFPQGVEVDSDRWGGSLGIQLPTRWFTFIANAYRGADLRFFFANQFFSTRNDFTGLTATAGTVALPGCAPAAWDCGPSIDGSSIVLFGLSGTTPVAVPQRPIRGQGGFLELGFPLSRLFHANPAGRNAGWTMNLHYGLDQAVTRDIRSILTPLVAANTRRVSDWAFGNIQYKMNQYITFGYEVGYYRTRADGLAKFEGLSVREAHDLRSEFATIFTF